MTSLTGSRSLVDQRVHAQDTQPLDERDGVLWVDTSKSGNPIYVFDGDTREWKDANPTKGVLVTDEATTFEESDVTASLTNAHVNSGTILMDEYSSEIGPSSTLNHSNNDYTDQSGLYFTPDVDLDGIRVTGNQSQTKTLNAYLMDGSVTNVLDQTTISASETIELRAPLTAGTEYTVVADDSGNLYNSRFADWTGKYPTSNDVITVNAGYKGGVRNSDWWWNFFDFNAIYPYPNAEAVIEWTPPQDIYAWDMATYQADDAGETLTVDIIDSNGNVLKSNIPRDDDISGIDAANDIRLKVNFSRTTTAQPQFGYAGRRFER